MTSQKTGGLKPSRRTLVKGAAWSVPVVMMAQPAMAACASNPDDCAECLQVVMGNNSCKYPDNKTYKLEICFINDCEEGTLTVFVEKIRSNSSGYPDVPVNQTLEIPYGERRCVFVEIESTNMGNFQHVDFVIGGSAQTRRVSTTTWGDCPGPTSTDVATTDVKVDQVPATTDATSAPAPVESTEAPAPAPADDASATSAP